MPSRMHKPPKKEFDKSIKSSYFFTWIIVFFHLKHRILLLSFSRAFFTPTEHLLKPILIDNTQVKFKNPQNAISYNK